VTEVEGRARIEGVAVLIHKSYLDGHGSKVAEDAVFTTPCVVIIFDEAPRYREVQSKSENKHPETGGTAQQQYGRRHVRKQHSFGHAAPTNKICRGAPRATHEQDRIIHEMV